MVMRVVNGVGNVTDMWSEGYGTPVTDTQQSVTLLSASEADGVSTVSVRSVCTDQLVGA